MDIWILRHFQRNSVFLGYGLTVKHTAKRLRCESRGGLIFLLRKIEVINMLATLMGEDGKD